jgi:transcriptional regulator with XRE-family HTH domain
MEATDVKQEFRDILEASGWSQAEAARQLGMTPSALSQIVRENSSVKPSPVTLRLFRLLLWREKPAAMRRMVRRKIPPGAEKWERDLILALRKIPPQAREPILGALGAMIDTALAKNARNARRSKAAQAKDR